MAEITIQMVMERETKNKVVYSAKEDSQAVESIYVIKAAIGRPFPENVTLTLDGAFDKS